MRGKDVGILGHMCPKNGLSASLNTTLMDFESH